MYVHCSTAGIYAPQQKNYSLCTPFLLERQYMAEAGAHDSFIFSMNVLSSLCNSRGLNYLSYIRKEMLRDTGTIRMESAQREPHKHTHTHIHISGITPNPHTCRNVFIKTLKHTHRHTHRHTEKTKNTHTKTHGSVIIDAWESVIICMLIDGYFFLYLECWSV